MEGLARLCPSTCRGVSTRRHRGASPVRIPPYVRPALDESDTMNASPLSPLAARHSAASSAPWVFTLGLLSAMGLHTWPPQRLGSSHLESSPRAGAARPSFLKRKVLHQSRLFRASREELRRGGRTCGARPTLLGGERCMQVLTTAPSPHWCGARPTLLRWRTLLDYPSLKPT